MRSARPPLLLLAPATLLALVGCGKSAPERRPNVLFVLVDALRPDHVSAYGYRRATTPAIDEIAAAGARFDNANCQATWTGSSMASFLTGLYPSTHGVVTNPVHTGGETFASAVLSDVVATLPEALRAHGYRTAAFVTNTFLRPSLGFAQGYDPEDYRMFEHSAAVKTPAEVVNREAIAWLQSRPPEPFFLYLHYMDVHGPYDPPVPYDSFFRPDEPDLLPPGVFPPPHLRIGDSRDLSLYRARYDGAIRYCDDELGKVLKALDALGLRESTLVVVTSDHGEEFFEHGGFGHGRTLYEELLRIPLVMRLPGRIPAATSVSAGVRAIDVYPTILDLCDVPAPHAMHGRSLVRHLTGKDRTEREIFAETHVKGGGLLCRKYGPAKSIFQLDRKEISDYFRLDSDPGEKHSILDKLSGSERAALRKAFNDYLAQRSIEAETWATKATETFDSETVRKLRGLGYLHVPTDPNR